MNDLLLASQDHANSLEDHVQHLTKRIVGLKNLISNSAKRLHNASKSKTSEPVDDSKTAEARWKTLTSRSLQTAQNDFFNQKYFHSSVRLDVDKKMSELSCADDDHPLKLVDKSPAYGAGTSNDATGAEGIN